ncbi:Cyclin-dependent kinase inhibitor FAR1 [Madurella mycetomatis]|uniref:Cyclin-dependent kinase inhibitor FAR1 n=1 Tax=Madurella mycetomatis TaxID=100816 RepID=A0A175VZ82_9PEZI|nr:Cyclin-dependent kinase inhibitor FAR1 [Madurella mycetomatis]KXX79132.1 Cyclin-dependent kinase inhibitor FAR1 [Madurella mycetomatis]
MGLQREDLLSSEKARSAARPLPGPQDGTHHFDHGRPFDSTDPRTKDSIRSYPYKEASFPPFDGDLPFWPTLKRYLISLRQNPYFHPKRLPTAICTLCSKALSIPHLNSNLGQDPSGDPTVVIPCGHMFHYSCATRLFTSYSNRNLHPHCPVCNLVLRYANPAVCRHSLRPFVLSLDVPAPPTIPEGGFIPAACTDCRVRQAWHHLHLAETMLLGEGTSGPAVWWMYDPLRDTDEADQWAVRAGMVMSLHVGFRGVIWAEGEMERRRPTWAGSWGSLPLPGPVGEPLGDVSGINGAAGGGGGDDGGEQQ